MLLITIFVELHVIAGRSRTRAGEPTDRLLTAVLCRGLEKKGMVRAWHGRGMASVNQTRPNCVNQMGKTHSKPLAARHGRGTAWARHSMCESAFRPRGHWDRRVMGNTQLKHVGFFNLSVFLTSVLFSYNGSPLSLTLVDLQLDAQNSYLFTKIHLLKSSTCFDHYCDARSTNHQDSLSLFDFYVIPFFLCSCFLYFYLSFFILSFLALIFVCPVHRPSFLFPSHFLTPPPPQQ
jgi:hypothetical protein